MSFEISGLLLTIQTLELAVTSALIGLIWLIQIVHYPLFIAVGGDQFPSYEQQHCNRITLMVAPLMLAESALPWHTCGEPRFDHKRAWSVAARQHMGEYFLVQVPLHNRLARGFDVEIYHKLVHTNWIRTVAWTARGLLLLGSSLSATM